MEIKNIPISKVEVNKGQIDGLPKNPRFIKDERFKALVKSIKDAPEMLDLRELLVYPFLDKYVVIGGNMRLRACKELGYKEVPCKVLPRETPVEKLREYTIKDNNGFGQNDWDVLANDWDFDELEEWGMDIADIDLSVPDEESEKEIVEDDVPEVDEVSEPTVKRGEVWQLGRHRLMCGDSTSKDDVEKLMRGEKADLVFTDPPYNLETKGGSKDYIGKSLNKLGESIEFISNFEPINFLNLLPCVFEKHKLNSYIFCNKDLLPTYLNWAVDNNYSYNVLVWKKPNAIPICDSHRPDIEYLLLFRKNAIWNSGLIDVNYSRCLDYSREFGLHPTMKPLGLIGNEIQISSNKNSVVLDLFGGSGSTLIACDQLNRTCYTMELDPKYCDVIIKRWETLTKQTAVKIE